MLVWGIRQRSGMISFALESPGFESHTDILSLSFLSFFSITTARQSIFYYSLLMNVLICDYIICDRPFSHMGQEYPFLWLSEIFLSRPACLILGQTCCPNCPSLLYEPPHDKTNQMACAPSEDLDHPGHPPSLI